VCPTFADPQKTRIGEGGTRLLVLEDVQEAVLAELGAGEN
jgi:hypothetical protein